MASDEVGILVLLRSHDHQGADRRLKEEILSAEPFSAAAGAMAEQLLREGRLQTISADLGDDGPGGPTTRSTSCQSTASPTLASPPLPTRLPSAPASSRSRAAPATPSPSASWRGTRAPTSAAIRWW